MYLKKIIKKKIFKLISSISNKLNYKTYLIGGYVRNYFLKINNSKDIDIVTTGDSEKLAKFFLKKKKKSKLFIFKRYKTAIVKYKKYNIEFVSTRKEYYNIYDNKPYVILLNSIKKDQKRRDFTINSIAISLNNKNLGKIIDTFSGIKDIKKKIIKTPINPNITFKDDPLRMIRAIRFVSQFKFKISIKSIKAIKKHRNRIRIISIERIIQEFNKILLTSKPSIGLKLMYNFGFLYFLLPEFIELKFNKKYNNFSYKNNFKHTLKVLDKLSKKTQNL
ncbi:MAG: tRNA nucleotidyltransferase, partial [Candidatus Shikimatogenerans sp. JK-2022]|nr:tRNA nucleotidyltransferase [Candidatus Shikimatogenerans bostrichidophilus]